MYSARTSSLTEFSLELLVEYCGELLFSVDSLTLC